jgi:double-stranded uracil-DNA glycosylase
MSNERVYHPLAPIVSDDSTVLILGSFPSIKSFEYEFYYAHPRNQFWAILSEIYGRSTQTRDDKLAILKFAKIALWDTIASCERANSSDSNLKNAKPNDIEWLLKKYPNIERVFFTGRMAEKLYKKRFGHLNFPTVLLPSPSPAYAAMEFGKKLEIWSSLLI